jgi:hypothetical protein
VTAASRLSSGSRARKAATGSRTSTGSASRMRKAASRPSTGGGIKAEHWVKGEEGCVEGSDGVGVEADKRRRWWRRGRD